MYDYKHGPFSLILLNISKKLKARFTAGISLRTVGKALAEASRDLDPNPCSAID